MFDAPTNDSGVVLMESALDSPKRYASTIRNVDTWTQLLVGTYVRVADPRINHAVFGSHARVVDTWISHALTASQARAVYSTQAGRFIG